MIAQVVLASVDSTLIEAVTGIIRSIAHLELKVLPQLDETLVQLAGEKVSLLLVHLQDGSDIGPASRLLQRMPTSQHVAATVVVSDRPHAEQELILLRQGAADYLSRPLDLGRLSFLIEMLTIRARYTPKRTAGMAQGVNEEHGLLYRPGTALGRIMEQVRIVAPQDTTILLAGETGTGKSRLAQVIHNLGSSRTGPFLTANCGVLAATLLESELFGHVKGAFTGADRDRTGRFADAGCGTLLLDEIDTLPLALQPKLLRVLEDRVFEPIGSSRSVPFQARLIVASNSHLDQEVAAGRFAPTCITG